MSFLLPREGLTLEAAVTPFKLILNPAFTGFLLAALYYFSNQVERTSQGYISPKALTTSPYLWCIFVLGFVRKINSLLSLVVLNSFTRSAWNHGEEIVVVTGGSNGLGEAIVREVAKSARVVIAFDIVPPKTAFPSNAHYLKVDITSTPSIDAAATTIRKLHGSPTILINNAGKAVCRPILNETEEQIRSVFNLNLISHFMLVKAFLPAMIKVNHGHVVTVASMGSFTVQAQNVDYGCSKAAVLAFHEGLGQELRWRYNARKVKTTIVHPAYVRTPMLKPNLDHGLKALIHEPETIAEVIVKQLHSGYGGQIIIPERFGFVTGIRGWSSWVQEVVRNGLAGELEFYGTEGR